MTYQSVLSDALFKHTQDVVICLDQQGKVIALNPSAASFYRWSPQEILGKDYHQACMDNGFPAVLPSHIQTISLGHTLKTRTEVTVDKIHYVHDWTVLRPSQDFAGVIMIGTLAVNPSTVKVQLDSQKTPGFSRSKYPQQRDNIPAHAMDYLDYLSTIAECMPGNFYWKDLSGYYIDCNSRLLRTGSYQRSDVIGKTDYDLWPEHLAQLLRENDAEVIASDKVMEFIEEIGLPDGSIRYFLSVKMPLKDRQGGIVGMIGNSLDITAQKQVQKVQAEAASIAKTRFIQNMSHDLFTPISATQAAFTWIAEHSEESAVRELAASMLRSNSHLRDTLGEMVEYARCHDQTTLQYQRVDLRGLSQYVFELLRPAAEQKGVSLAFCCDDQIPQEVISDGFRIKQSLLNLIANAIKFTQQGSVSLTVSLTDMVDHHAQVTVQVADTGIGIASEDQAKIFERFTRLTPAYEGNYAGTGLGLSLTQGFVQDLGGSISVESAVGQGSCFTVVLSLPVAQPDSEELPYKYSAITDTSRSQYLTNSRVQAEEEKNHQASSLELTPSSTRKLKVLLVEDNAGAQRMGSLILNKLDCEVSVAGSSAEALACAQQTTYDFIYMDIGLPDQNGMVTTAAIRAWEKEQGQPRVPIVALTAHGDDEVKSQCLEAGLDDVLSKPMSAKATLALFQQFSLQDAACGHGG